MFSQTLNWIEEKLQQEHENKKDFSKPTTTSKQRLQDQTKRSSGKKNVFFTWMKDTHEKKYIRKKKKIWKKSEGPVTMAVRPVPSRPSVTCSAVDDDENPEAPFLPNGHILSHTQTDKIYHTEMALLHCLKLKPGGYFIYTNTQFCKCYIYCSFNHKIEFL